MKNLGILLTIIFINSQITFLAAQTVVKMQKSNGIYIMPCKVNGLALNFIFDTGASHVSISLTEALFMLKNGYLSKNDLAGTEYYRIANGDIEEGTKVMLGTIEIGRVKLYNVKASISHNLNAPLLLGQSALSKLKRIEFNYANNTLTILEGPEDYVFSDRNVRSYQSSSSSKVALNYSENGKRIKLKPYTIIYSEPYIVSNELVRYTDGYVVILGLYEPSGYYKIKYGTSIGYVKKNRVVTH